MNSAYNGATPVGNEGRGLTDLYVSPEIMETIRGFAYNPVNSKLGVSGATTGIPLTDSVRERIFSAAGMSDIWGVTLHELLELGAGAKYNVLFKELSAGKTYAIPGGSGTAFDAAGAGTDQVLIGIDRSRRSFIRTLAVNAETGGSFNLRPDDQFLARSGKVGFYGGLEEGRVALDARAVAGIIV